MLQGMLGVDLLKVSEGVSTGVTLCLTEWKPLVEDDRV